MMTVTPPYDASITTSITEAKDMLSVQKRPMRLPVPPGMTLKRVAGGALLVPLPDGEKPNTILEVEPDEIPQYREVSYEYKEKVRFSRSKKGATDTQDRSVKWVTKTRTHCGYIIQPPGSPTLDINGMARMIGKTVTWGYKLASQGIFPGKFDSLGGIQGYTVNRETGKGWEPKEVKGIPKVSLMFYERDVMEYIDAHKQRNEQVRSIQKEIEMPYELEKLILALGRKQLAETGYVVRTKLRDDAYKLSLEELKVLGITKPVQKNRVKEERETRGMEILEIEYLTKINRHALDAIENNLETISNAFTRKEKSHITASYLKAIHKIASVFSMEPSDLLLAEEVEIPVPPAHSVNFYAMVQVIAQREEWPFPPIIKNQPFN